MVSGTFASAMVSSLTSLPARGLLQPRRGPGQPLAAPFLSCDRVIVDNHLTARQRGACESREIPPIERRPVRVRLHRVAAHGARRARMNDRQISITPDLDHSL